MQKMNHKTEKLMQTAGIGFLLLALIFCTLSGAKPVEAVYFWLFTVCYLWLPGAFWYRVLRLAKAFPPSEKC